MDVLREFGFQHQRIEAESRKISTCGARLVHRFDPLSCLQLLTYVFLCGGLLLPDQIRELLKKLTKTQTQCIL